MKKLLSTLLVIIMTVTLFPLTSAAAEATETKITGIPVISQWPNLPTGCEATSLTMLLNFFGTDLSKEQVVSMQPSGPNIYRVNGVYMVRIQIRNLLAVLMTATVSAFTISHLFLL